MKLHIIFVVTLTSLVLGCATQKPSFQDPKYLEKSFIETESALENAPPLLQLTAFPTTGFSPMRVTFRATLQNVSVSNPKFDCLWESWHFGDGSSSAERNNCGTTTTGTPQISVNFIAEHVYEEKGYYQVFFVLGDRVLISNPVHVNVLR